MEILWVKYAIHLEGYKLKLEFNNGETKEVDLKNYLNKPIFKPLKDLDYFAKFKLNPFTIEWDNGADFAPEFLYRIGKDL
jgi:hypothetical protein